VTFADKAQAALSAAGALQKAGTALSTAESAASTGNGGLIGGISGAIQAAQARPLPAPATRRRTRAANPWANRTPPVLRGAPASAALVPDRTGAESALL